MSEYGIPGIPLMPPGPPRAGVPLELPKDVVRVGEQAIWSSNLITAAAVANTTHRLFGTALGQNGQGFAPMSLAETNLKEGGRIPAGLAYDTFGVACIPSSYDAPPITQADLTTCYDHGVLSWDFLQTVIDVAPLSLIGAGGGVFGISDSTADNGYMNNGNGGLWVYRRHPIALPANTTFNILCRFGNLAPAIAADTVIKVLLVGAYRQAVEIA